jgi:hypothetical protein
MAKAERHTCKQLLNMVQYKVEPHRPSLLIEECLQSIQRRMSEFMVSERRGIDLAFDRRMSSVFGRNLQWQRTPERHTLRSPAYSSFKRAGVESNSSLDYN